MNIVHTQFCLINKIDAINPHGQKDSALCLLMPW